MEGSLARIHNSLLAGASSSALKPHVLHQHSDSVLLKVLCQKYFQPRIMKSVAHFDPMMYVHRRMDGCLKMDFRS